MSEKNEFVWPAGKRAAVSLTFDDARPSQSEALRILDAHGVKGTFYISLAAAEQNIEIWRSAVAGGHEIGNHTMSHPCSANFPWARKSALEDYTLERMEA